MIHVRSVGALGVAVDAQRGGLQIAAVLRLVAQRVLADEVALERLVRGCREECRFGEQLDLQRQQVAENARQGDHHVHARPAELVERNQRRAGNAAVGVESRLGAHQRQRLGDRRALGLQIVGAPQHQSDRLGKLVALRHVPLDETQRLAGAVAHREGARNAERIEAVQIASGGQHRRRSHHVAARRRPQEPAVESAQDGADFAVVATAAHCCGAGRAAAASVASPGGKAATPKAASGVLPSTMACTASCSGAAVDAGGGRHGVRPSRPENRPARAWRPGAPRRAARAVSRCTRAPAVASSTRRSQRRQRRRSTGVRHRSVRAPPPALESHRAAPDAARGHRMGWRASCRAIPSARSARGTAPRWSPGASGS